jgi:cyclic pyranopterin phosphate synthase
MPEIGAQFVPRTEILSFEEIHRFARLAAALGITRIRLTGGEPLLRNDLPLLIRMLCAIPGIEDVALTTNGVLLGAQAEALHAAGLRRINIHLDTLDRGRFAHITRRDNIDHVLEGIRVCKRLGFDLIKINAVAMKNLVETDIVPLACFGRENDIEIRYIEFMPLDAQGLWDHDRVLVVSDILKLLTDGIGPLEELPDSDPRAPALEYRFADGIGRIGFIASVSRPFCENCNRIRLTADGKLRYCLFANEETDIKELLRSKAPDERVMEVIQSTVRKKWEGHQINSSSFVAPSRPMHSIGG